MNYRIFCIHTAGVGGSKPPPPTKNPQRIKDLRISPSPFCFWVWKKYEKPGVAPTYTQSGTFDAIQPEAAPCCAAGTRHEEPHAHEGAWWFVITDIVAALTDATDPSDYWKKMRRRDPDLSLDSQGGTNPSSKSRALQTLAGQGGERTPR